MIEHLVSLPGTYRKHIALGFALGALVFGQPGGTAFAAGAPANAMADWCFNANGDTNSACNGAGSGGNGINISQFDTTLEPGANTLGSASITLGPGANQFALAYMDYDLNYNNFGSFTDYGSVIGTAPAGVSYELDDPNSGNIFTDFASGSLGNFNNVGTPGNPPTVCCDVAWALGVNGINVPAGHTDVVTFTVSATAPNSGFYLEQSNAQANDNIFLSETSVLSSGPPAVPEPATWVMFILGFGAVAALLRCSRQRGDIPVAIFTPA